MTTVGDREKRSVGHAGNARPVFIQNRPFSNRQAMRRQRTPAKASISAVDDAVLALTNQSRLRLDQIVRREAGIPPVEQQMRICEARSLQQDSKELLRHRQMSVPVRLT